MVNSLMDRKLLCVTAAGFCVIGAFLYALPAFVEISPPSDLPTDTEACNSLLPLNQLQPLAGQMSDSTRHSAGVETDQRDRVVQCWVSEGEELGLLPEPQGWPASSSSTDETAARDQQRRLPPVGDSMPATDGALLTIPQANATRRLELSSAEGHQAHQSPWNTRSNGQTPVDQGHVPHALPARVPEQVTGFQSMANRSFNRVHDHHASLEAEIDWESGLDTASQIPRHVLLSVNLSPSVAARARKMLDDATRLADRGAICSARQQFVRVLRMTCQSLDARVGRPIHTRALVNGMRALEEAEDFAMTDTSPESDIHLRGYIAGHRTPVLKEVAANEVTSLLAMQRYYKYAYGQLVVAGNNEPVASAALYSLGRIETLVSETEAEHRGGGPQSIVYYHSALTVDPSNTMAANELGVMLARRGRMSDALGVMERAVAIRPSASLVRNLASIQSRVGRQDLAQRNFQRAIQLAPPSNLVVDSPIGKVQWMSPAEFARAGIPSMHDDQTATQRKPVASAQRQPHAKKRGSASETHTATKSNYQTWDY